MAYRYRPTEIEAMKRNILSHIEHETVTDHNGNKSAWRLACCLSGLAYCVRQSKREQAKRERELALYYQLTNNNMPNF